jgi:hypothetical protein
MHNPYLVRLHLFATWLGLLAGVSSGAVMGLFFQREDWLGGYGSFPRRLIRLGHVSFFGLGLINALFALTVAFISLPELAAHCASIGLVTAQHHAALLFPLRLAETVPLPLSAAGWESLRRHIARSLHASALMKIGFIAMSGLRLCDANCSSSD